MSVRRLHSVARFAVIRDSIGAQVGRIANAVEGAEGYDPSGILVSATDTAQGCRIQIAGGEDTATPAAGVSWSVPLKDVAGRLIGPVKSVTTMRFPFQFTAAAKQLAAWAGHATPTGNAYWIGIINGPIGATRNGGMFWLCQNVAAGEQRVASMRWVGTATPNTATLGHADIKGVVGTSGALAGATNNDAIAAGHAVAYEGSPTGGAYTVLSADRIGTTVGNVPHLIWGCGGPTADTIEFAALVAAMSVVDLTDLTVR